ncbi:hypothetical protein XH79_28240 [Bradyrhizobium sp. CCBAU 45389]|nr:hypothetical protein [Bradyrhizobium sp. CCBAU 45389]
MIMRIALWLLVLMTIPARADRVGYTGIVDLSAEAGTLRAEHHHDWGGASQNARWKMFSSTKDPFTADNDYSYLRLRNTRTGTELFRRPVPALTYIWISPDLKYVVGLSHVMLLNPYQLVVFSKSGDRLLERNMIGAPGAKRSVTNWIYWYKEPVPKITIVENGATATLSVEDESGLPREFQFPAAR